MQEAMLKVETPNLAANTANQAKSMAEFDIDKDKIIDFVTVCSDPYRLRAWQSNWLSVEELRLCSV
jgi:hypothetical protein